MLFRYLWASPNTLLGLAFAAPVIAAGGKVRLIRGVLEVHGRLASLVLRRLVPLDGGAAAMTFGHVVVGVDPIALDATREHERVHVRQCEMWGPLFLPAYSVAAAWGLLRHGCAYRGNYFERQAWHEEKAGGC